MCRNGIIGPVSRAVSVSALLAVAGLTWSAQGQTGLVRAVVAPAASQAAALTYQGQLFLNGAPYTGVTTLRFALYDAPAGGRHVGQTLELAGAAVNSGVFVADLPYTRADLAGPRFIELSVKVGENFVAITPRQPVPALGVIGTPGQTHGERAPAGEANTGAPVTAGLSGAVAAPGASFNVSTNIPGGHGGAPDTGVDWSCTGTTLHYTGGSVGVGTTSPTTGLFEAVSANTTAIAGISNATIGIVAGVRGTTTAPGGRGVWGTASAVSGFPSGVFGESAAPTGRGVLGRNSSASGSAYGGFFDTASPTGIGAYAEATNTSGTTSYGFYGVSRGLTGAGVYGESTDITATTNFGVQGVARAVNGRGVFGLATNGSGFCYGVYGTAGSSPNGRGVFGDSVATSGSTVGVFGNARSPAGTGVLGNVTSTTGTTFGVQGRVVSPTGRGVYGEATSTSGLNYGGYFFTNSIVGTGVFGVATALTGSPIGGDFISGGPTGMGVQARATDSSGANAGVMGISDSSAGVGVMGEALATTGAVYGIAGSESSSDVNAFAVFANGDVGASGTKPFRIDHPADPANMYLYHYAAESNEVINFYSGTVQLDASGGAVIELPAYFMLINTAPRYQLTAVGAPMPMLHVAEKITTGDSTASFRVAGGAPGGEVSWEVKARRNDPYVQQRGAPVEVPKTGREKGTYQHPEFYGQPQSKRLFALPAAPAPHTPAPQIASDAEVNGQQ